MPTTTEKSKVLHSFKACFKVLTTKMNQLQTQLMAMSNLMSFLIYQIAEMVFDCLPKSSRVMTLLQIYLKKTQLSSFGANIVEHQNTFDLGTEDLSTKGLERNFP